MHGWGHRDCGGADGFDAVEDFFHVLLVGIEGGLIEAAVGSVVHSEEDGDVFWFEGGDVCVESAKGVLCAVATDAGVMEAEAHAGVARVEVVLDVLGVEALVSDGVAEEDNGITLCEIHFRVDGLEGGLCLRSGVLSGKRKEGGD